MIRKQGKNIIDLWDLIATNAIGSDTVAGGVYSLDLTRIAAGSIDSDSAMGNVVACATANLRGFLVVSPAIVKAGATGRFILRGITNVLVDGTTDVAAGDKLIPQNASPNLIKQAGLVNACAVALVAQTADAGTLAECMFDGENWKGEKAVS